jgi:MIP family channel proteins
MDDKLLRTSFVEMVGTFALVFVSAGAVMVTAVGGLQPASVAIAFAAGLIYAGALAFSLPTAGGYLNPAVVVTLWVFRRVDGMRATALICAQLLGAFVAALLLFLVFPKREDVYTATHLGTPHVNLNAFDLSGVTLTSILKGIGIEATLTFILVMVIFALAVDPRGARRLGAWGSRMTALWLGIVLAAITIFAFPLTGAAANPARWFGPALSELMVESLKSRAFADHAVYWIGPIAGALIAGWVYTALVLEEAETQTTASAKPIAGSPSGGLSSTLQRAKK